MRKRLNITVGIASVMSMLLFAVSCSMRGDSYPRSYYTVLIDSIKYEYEDKDLQQREIKSIKMSYANYGEANVNTSSYFMAAPYLREQIVEYGGDVKKSYRYTIEDRRLLVTEDNRTTREFLFNDYNEPFIERFVGREVIDGADQIKFIEYNKIGMRKAYDAYSYVVSQEGNYEQILREGQKVSEFWYTEIENSIKLCQFGIEAPQPYVYTGFFGKESRYLINVYKDYTRKSPELERDYVEYAFNYERLDINELPTKVYIKRNGKLWRTEEYVYKTVEVVQEW